MRRALAITLVALLLLPMLAVAKEGHDATYRKREGGHAVLFEHYTSTWCDVCATIDPWMDGFVDDHEGRVERVALHPDDHDPFGSPLTTERIARLSPDESLPLPTFWMDGGEEMQGSTSAGRLSGALMRAELARAEWTPMTLVWITEEGEHRISVVADIDADVTVTLLLKRTLTMEPEEVQNGVARHTDVLVGRAELTDTGVLHRGEHEDVSTWTDHDGAPGIRLNGSLDGVVAVVTVADEIRGVAGLSENEVDAFGLDAADVALLTLLLALVGSGLLLRRGGTE